MEFTKENGLKLQEKEMVRISETLKNTEREVLENEEREELLSIIYKLAHKKHSEQQLKFRLQMEKILCANKPYIVSECEKGFNYSVVKIDYNNEFYYVFSKNNKNSYSYHIKKAI